MRRALVVAAMAAVPTLGLQLASHPPAAGQDPVTARGFDLYVAGCASCHAIDGTGTANGPTLIGVGAASVDFMLATGRMPLANPGEQPVRNPPKYSDEQVEALVAFVTSLAPGAGPPIPAVAPGSGDLAGGRDVFGANCLACHGAAGQGASVGGGAVAPSLHQATPTELAEALRTGPGVMPRFTEEVIDQEDLDSLVRYILSLREGQDAGGLGLGHVGPVIEGLVGWVVGMGIIILVLRFTGTRT